MQALTHNVTRVRLALVGAATGALFAFYGVAVQSAHAVASPTTGIDYVTDLITPVKSELTLAIVAGLGLMVVLIAVCAGTRLVKSFGK